MLPAATLIVINYAAITNGAADDTAAIQRAINASASGDTIYFSPGEYPLTNTIILKPDRIYSGQGALLIQHATNTFIAATAYDNGVNISVRGLTFYGYGIRASECIVGLMKALGRVFKIEIVTF